jgi:phosphatidyl-myo-inositol dimannoside synthase
VKSLLLAPELFSSGGGITRILRLYLKALCEDSGNHDEVRFVSLNDRMVATGDLRRFSTDRLAGWEVCNRGRLQFIFSAFKMGLRSDRIICGHVAQLPVAWAISLLRPKLRYYLVAHGIEVWRPFTFLERRALIGARRIFCVSNYTRLQILSNCPMPEAQTAVLYNALDPFMEARAPVPPADGVNVILSISRLSVSDSYKGIEHLIGAMPAVRAAIPNAQLRIVGRGDGLRPLQMAASKLNIAAAVDFAGYRNDAELGSEFENCRMFALPSQKEGFGLVYLEAMTHGRPCLGANAGGVAEVITEESGLLVEYGDIPGIAAALILGLSRSWPIQPIVDRAQRFSYGRFRERLAKLLAE